MAIAPGTTVRMKDTRNLSFGDDEEPILVLRAGDRLVATEAEDPQGFLTFIHIPTGVENIRLHRDDVVMH